MATTTIESGDRDVRSPIGARLDQPSHPAARLLFGLALLGGLGYAGYSIFLDTQHVGETLATGVFLFLALALVIALGFEFVNGFHDTANAVATVIYTNSMPAPFAVVWSGVWNLIGVLLSSGAVAYSIVTLLPVDLILHVGSNAGFAMIFALLLAAVIWNLATWYFGIPNSSSHALIGSILGVGFANQLLTAGTGGTQGVDWSQAEKVLSSLLFSPLVGFVGALVLLLVMKLTLRNPNLYKAPEGDTPPPTGIRALLIFTCTAVSFAHGGNDGQKGMGLIMLILIGCAPTAYALNRTMPASETPAFVQHATAAAAVFHSHAQGTPIGVEAARQALTSALKTRNASTPVVYAAIETVTNEISHDVGSYGSLSQIPSAAASNLRNDMYLVLDSSRMATKAKDANKTFSAAELK
ncbi:MAG: inorganic phosphate transporter, partial [Sphingomonas sp.]